MKQLVVLLAFSASLSIHHPTAGSDTARPATVKVAAVQCSSDLGAVEANSAKLAFLVEEAARNGAKIIVLPETAITGYLSQDLKTNWHVPGMPLDKRYAGKNPAGFAETVPGPSTKRFAALAERLKVYLTIPLLEFEERDGKKFYYNTVCLASPQGKLIAHYRKLTPWPLPEKSWATPGDRGVAVAETEYGKVGLAICYDIHSILGKYRPENIWALLYPIAWVDTSHPADWFWHSLPEKLSDTPHHVIGANWSVDGPQRWRGYGFSSIYGPGGKLLASAKSLYGFEIIYAEIATQAGDEKTKAAAR